MPPRRRNGEGTISGPRKDGRYEGKIFLPTTEGTLKRVTVYGRSWDDVNDELIKLKAQAIAGMPTPTATQRMDAYLAYWLADVAQPKVRPSTFASYKILTESYLIPGLGKHRLNRLAARDVRQWLVRTKLTCQCCRLGKDARRVARGQEARCCAKRPKDCCGNFPSDGTIAYLHRLLRAALQDAMEDDLIARNVAKLVHPARGQRRKIAPFGPDEARLFLKAAREHRLFALWSVALSIGLRRGEALGLRWQDLDLVGGELHIRQTLQRVSGRLVFGAPKTADSERSVPLPAPCADALREHRAQQDRDRAAAGDRWVDSGLVFTTRHGTAIEPRNLNRAFGVLCEAAGVRSIRFHDLRHSCATLLYAQGVELGTIQNVLGHSSIAVTKGIYVEVTKRVQQEAVDRLNDLYGSDDSSAADDGSDG